MSTVLKDKGVDLDQVLNQVWKMGCACATDLATQIGRGIEPNELVAPLEALVSRGKLRHKVDPADPRDYSSPEQTVYEPVM